MMRPRLRTTIAVLAISACACFAAWRISQTAEYISRYGSTKDRTDLCRAIPELSAVRRKQLYHRLLRDSDSTVRSAALTAVERSGPLSPELIGLVHALATSNGQPADVRQKAGGVLLSLSNPTFEKYLEEEHKVLSYQKMCPDLVTTYMMRTLDEKDNDKLTGLVRVALNEKSPIQEHVQSAILAHANPFKRIYPFIDDQSLLSESFGNAEFLQTLKQQIQPPPPPKLPPAVRFKGHVFEAEWAYAIRPNYQIRNFKGVSCLALGEGAGGYMSWLKGRHGTVDIGTARFSMHVPAAGRYRIFARVYLDDKCGNSFGFRIGTRRYANFPDSSNILDKWHWLCLTKMPIELREGFHPITLEAWEDAVFIDKFAILADGESPAPYHNRAQELWDPSFRSSISFTMQQAQCRGTTQTVRVWIRRSSPDIKAGVCSLDVPKGFLLESPASAPVRFKPGSPLAFADYRITLPTQAVLGETTLTASCTEKTGEAARIQGQTVLGAQFDWLTTGPLKLGGPRQMKYHHARNASDDDLKDWIRYPAKGYDQFRRLVPESAWGQLTDRFVYFCTDIRVDEDGTYMAFLTMDDQGTVWIDGKPVVALLGHGPAEGRMQHASFRLTKGKHRIFVSLYQAGFEDPAGPDAGRRSLNNCAFKLLLRRERHLPAPEIKGLPMRP